MTCLGPLRLPFAGTFPAYVSTGNRDPWHVGDDALVRRSQEYPAASSPSMPSGAPTMGLCGGWDPEGAGANRLLGRSVRRGHSADATTAASRVDDRGTVSDSGSLPDAFDGPPETRTAGVKELELQAQQMATHTVPAAAR